VEFYKATWKATGGEGPWQGEPDKVEFTHNGYPCVIMRGPLGALNGYVAVPSGHPDFGKDYDDVDINVHGGLTYAEDSAPMAAADAGWWFGFDCAHAGDIVPGMNMYRTQRGDFGETYKDLAYVRAEIESLVAQFEERAK
jgi:hypothetical protein